jgi:DNA topoisomerase-1
MEELGIGRPSTYAPTVSTIIQRGYVTKEDRPGNPRAYVNIVLKKGAIKKENKQEITGTEKSKLFPSDIGMLVNDFLMENFKNVIDYNFTASVEEQFDEIAAGELGWIKMIDTFYKPFHDDIEKSKDVSRPAAFEKTLGLDPKTGKQVLVRIARFGPVAQLGVSSDDEQTGDKPVYASLKKGQLIENISLEEALKLFDLPRNIGEYESKTLTVAIGRFGPYIRFGDQFVSLGKTDDPYTVTSERAIELIEEKRLKDKEKTIKDFGNIKVLNGRFGPYIAFEGNNYKLPKDLDKESLTKEKCEELIQQQGIKPAKVSKTATKTAKTGKASETGKASKTSKASKPVKSVKKVAATKKVATVKKTKK